ncbi:phosphatidate cytidylyltransferase [Brevundimonas sp. FT23042]|uniref:phosphatidate cytidylyltransferase n=1 Tax=Brevundimonas sp. FT23042 TaxID=3393749 RepID=UPI003B58972F
MAMSAREIGLRTVSGIVLAGAAGLVIWAGGVWFLGIMLVACALLSVEWAMMSAARAWRLMAGAIGLGLFAAVISAFVGQLSLALVMLVFCAAAAGLFARSRGQEALDASYGVLYLGWPSILLIWLRNGDTPADPHMGLYWTIFAFMTTWTADSLAYLVGSSVGGPKLWPRFSPNKTWSGFVGGLAGGAVAGALMGVFLDMGIGLWGALLGLAAAAATMAGDLWESALKRRYGVKDAGKLIPGHGGLLDRVDGLMFAAVVVACGRLVSLWLNGGGA